METLGFNQRWLVVDVMLKHEMPKLGDHTLQYCDLETPSTYCRNVGLRRRWEFALPDSETNEDASDISNVWKRLSKWLTPEGSDIERRAIYTFKSEVARDWVKGRLVIAGDAAHLTPPFMGQGLCAGIRDAANLAWKLGFSCRSDNGPMLLKSYETERKPNVTEYIRVAVQLGELINRMGSTGKAEKPSQMQSLQCGLGEGLGDSSDPARGTLFGQSVLSNGRRLDDEVGYKAVLVTSHPINPGETFPGLQIIDATAEPSLMDELAALGVMAVLVRPDKRVLGAADSTEQTVRLLQTWAHIFSSDRPLLQE